MPMRIRKKKRRKSANSPIFQRDKSNKFKRESYKYEINKLEIICLIYKSEITSYIINVIYTNHKYCTREIQNSKDYIIRKYPKFKTLKENEQF